MLIREMIEQREEHIFARGAAHSNKSVGRVHPEPSCEIRTAFQRDRDRILHCKAFRRLKHKTQVFIAPEGDHYRTRLTHTLEVTQIARTIARALCLNEDLAEAIALGHDLGHTPFGHAGEDALHEVFSPGFRHNEQSLRVVEFLEKGAGEFVGLNLTYEVRDGILHHTGDGLPCTLEGQIVRLADRIAYINHDIDDAIRAGLLSNDNLPAKPRCVLGQTSTQRIDTLVRDVIHSSGEGDVVQIRQSAEVGQCMLELRQFMFDHVYIGSAAKLEETKVRGMLQGLFRYYLENPDALPVDDHNGESLDRQVCDYVAGMTDRYATADFARHFMPRAWGL